MIKFCRCFIVEICVFQYSQMNCGKTYEILYSKLAPISPIKHIRYNLLTFLFKYADMQQECPQ